MKSIIDLSVRAKSINVLEENLRKILRDFGSGKYFLNRTQQPQNIKEKVMNWTSLEVKAFSLPKTLLRKWKGKPQTERNFLQNIYLTRDLYRDYIKLLHLKNKKVNSLIFLMVKVFELSLYQICMNLTNLILSKRSKNQYNKIYAPWLHLYNVLKTSTTIQYCVGMHIWVVKL